ncbi:ATP-binding protein [Patescibacteria group bacterium]|nr:ATP-binding protein [Patescibacteria group bacterium]MBP9710490.1 ATP-binding protein [Patescibacteria group bacterium]
MLKSTVAKQKQDKERLLSLPYIERSKEKDTQKWLSSDLIKVILGPRRAGKSVFALMLLKDQSFAYFNFDDESLPGEEKIDLDELMAELKVAYGETQYILFDEIQNLPHWELFVNRLHRAGYNLVLTGSNASLLSKELATHLTGRHIPIEILPFNFAEFLKAKQYEVAADTPSLPDEKAKLLEYLTQYMANGGYPEVVTKGVDPRGYLDVLFDAVLFKDVVKRHKVRFSEQIDNLGSYLINNISGQHSPKKLAHVLGFKSQVTLENYLGYLTEAYLISPLVRHSTKVGMRLRSPKKTYAVDNGFVTAKAVQHSPNTGKLMENLVFTELVKKGNQPGRELFYYKTRNDREIDFVLKNGYQVAELIQVCYDLSGPDVERREVKALVEAGKELGVTKLSVLTWNEKRTGEKDGMTIHFKPLWEWLLEGKNIA